jgi:fused signal recognition particle receptor
MQEFQAQVSMWIEEIRIAVQSHAEYAALVVCALCVLCVAVVWSSARERRRLRRTIERLESEITSLRQAPVRELGEAEVFAPVSPEEVLQPVEPVPEEVPSTIPQPAPKIEAEREAEVAAESPVVRGLAKSRTGLLGRLASFFSGKSGVDRSMLDDLEEVLILSDVGARTASELVSAVRDVAEKQDVVSPSELKGLLKDGVLSRLVAVGAEHRIYTPTNAPMVVLVVGVNGVGKTTTVAKLAAKYQAAGKKVLVVAADTFRAAAVEQLAEWSNRVGFSLVRGPEGAKPGAVVFDGMVAAKEGAFDVVLIDTAGRLHNKSNLMQELEGVRNSIRKHIPEAPHETVLVLDGVSGQNALVQAREFNAAVQLTGVVVTKLDGTPKGGIIVAISQELSLPVFFIGVGEKVEDLLPFDRKDFVEALFEEQPHVSRGGRSNSSGAAVGDIVAPVQVINQ